ncbi:MAG TPA: catalase [Tenericutes bacterium]|nr:catalase [Mycoplasmatota bacterium]
MHIVKHFNTINKHKIEVMKLCFKCGLYFIGLTHDLSKYSITEFYEGSKYYLGYKSPISNCKKQTGKSEAWLHHKGRNKHHPEYWIDGENCVLMPYKYAVESICDRIAASKIYNKNNYSSDLVLKYWLNQKDSFKIHKSIGLFYERVFTDLIKFGEKQVINKKYLVKTYNECITHKGE